LDVRERDNAIGTNQREYIVVQLRAEQEALQQCRIDSSIAPPAWHNDDDLRTRLDAGVCAQVVDWVSSAGKKVLIIGAGWPELAGLLAQKGMFVTVVDDSADRIRQLQEKANELGGMGTVTCHVDDYSNRQFERAAFNRIVAWDVLNRFPTPATIVRKMTRELKAGGLLCVRTWVSPVFPELAWTERMGEWWRNLTGKTGGPLQAAYNAALEAHGPIPSHATAIPWTALQGVIAEHLVVQESVPHHGLVSDVAELVAAGHDTQQTLLTQLLDAEPDAPSATPETARYAAILAANEKQLGSVFSLKD